MKPSYIYLNGRVVARDRARISPWDRGWLFGQGLFETLRTYRGAPVLLEQHEQRLRSSAAALGLDTSPLDAGPPLRVVIDRLLQKNELGDAYVRLMLTAGIAEPPDAAPASLCVLMRPHHAYPRALYRRGADVVVSSIRRNPTCPLAAHKTLNYWSNLVARRQATDAGATESILLDTRGYIAEGSCTNVFFVLRKTLHTPGLRANILPGITRRAVIELAAAEGIAVAEGLYRLRDLQQADEAFLTNALMEVLPIRSVDGRRLARTCPGPVTQRLTQAYRAFVRRQVRGARRACR